MVIVFHGTVRKIHTEQDILQCRNSHVWPNLALLCCSFLVTYPPTDTDTDISNKQISRRNFEFALNDQVIRSKAPEKLLKWDVVGRLSTVISKPGRYFLY